MNIRGHGCKRNSFCFVPIPIPNTIVHNFLLCTKIHHLDMILFCSNRIVRICSWCCCVATSGVSLTHSAQFTFVYILPSKLPNGILFIKWYFQIKITQFATCIVQYKNHGTFMPLNVLHVHWHTSGDIADAQECSGIFQCYVMRHAMLLWYCFGYDVTVWFIEMRMFQTSGFNRK